MQERYVVAGGLRADYLITREGEVRNSVMGGNALYAASGAVVWAEQVAVWGRVGQNYPQEWISRLNRHGIGTDGIRRIEGSQDHRTFYAYQPDGRRVDTHPERHYARVGEPLPRDLRGYSHSTPGQDDPLVYDPLAVRRADWTAQFDGVKAIHLAPMPIHSHADLIPFLQGKGNIQITVDPGERYMKPDLSDHIRKYLPLIDAFLPSEQEMATLFEGRLDFESSVRTLGDWGARLVVIKRGARGVMIYQPRVERFVSLTPFHERGDRRVVDVTGAGDAFCGGFMIGLSQAGDPIHAARLGLVSASLTVEGYGALYPLSTPSEIRKERLRILENRKTFQGIPAE